MSQYVELADDDLIFPTVVIDTAIVVVPGWMYKQEQALERADITDEVPHD